MAPRAISDRLHIDRGTDRLCLKCTAALVVESRWGSWTWTFGVCATCQHFGVTVEGEYPRHMAKALAQPPPPSAEAWQQNLFDGDG